jgi:hypothetical protein
LHGWLFADVFARLLSLLRLCWWCAQVLSMRLCGASDHEHLSQVSSFLHLVPQGLFLTVCGHTPTTWDFKVCVLV